MHRDHPDTVRRHLLGRQRQRGVHNNRDLLAHAPTLGRRSHGHPASSIAGRQIKPDHDRWNRGDGWIAVAAGVGSPHTPPGYGWHLALAIPGLTTDDPREHDCALRMMEATDAGTGLMHEGFDADDPARFTRPWFSWANALYCGLVLASLGIDPVP